ncbi:MAG: hypothetical protein Q9200_005459, partial [Gallowayella weberi]
MLVCDIGDKGAVVFFSGLEMQEDQDGGTAIRGMVHRTSEMAKRFEMPNLQRLAYEIKNDPTIGFSEAKRRTKLPVEDGLRWQAFREEYLLPANPSPTGSLEQQPFLDPRLSELILQLSSPTERNDATIYLPFLIDDPSRASAWNISAEIRHTFYNLLATLLTPPSSTPFQSIKE